MPAHDREDYLQLDRSIISDRIKTVQWLFETYASEDVSFRALAHRLNELGVSPVYGKKGWCDAKVRKLLENPAYLGLPTWNKQGHGDFLEWKEGQYQEVEWENEKPVVGKKRKKAKSDHINPDKPIYEPFISKEVWDTVQKKIAAIQTGKRPPRKPELWLSGLLYCSKCNAKMHGWAQQMSYVCGTYRTYGPANPTGCTMHRVKHALLEPIIDRYLEESAKKVQFLKDADGSKGQGMTEQLEKEHGEKQKEAAKTERQMYDDVKKEIPFLDDYFQGETNWEALSELYGPGLSLQFTYGQFFQRRKAELKKELDEKDAEHTRLVKAYADLQGKAKDKARAMTDALEAEMKDLEARLTNLADKFDGLQKELEQKAKAIEQAKQVLKGQSPLKKAEALKGIISKVFIHCIRLDKPVRMAKDRLDRIEVVPVLGDVVNYGPPPFDTPYSPARG
jgi:hypothetical protein